MDKNILQLKKRIESLSLKELYDMVWINSKDYTTEAINLARNELSKYGSEEEVKKMLIEQEKKEQEKKEQEKKEQEKKEQEMREQDEEKKRIEKINKQRIEEESRREKIKSDSSLREGREHIINAPQPTFNRNDNYKVVPFNPSDNVPSSLQRIIDIETVNGWKYVNHQYSDKLKPGSAGCFGIGATPDSTVHIGFVIFEKK